MYKMFMYKTLSDSKIHRTPLEAAVRDSNVISLPCYPWDLEWRAAFLPAEEAQPASQLAFSQHSPTASV